LLVGWVVVGPSIKVEVGMGRFMVHPMAQSVKEGEVALSFGLHGELNALVNTVQVVQEVLQLVGFVWPEILHS
jgi:hypothetical protein